MCKYVMTADLYDCKIEFLKDLFSKAIYPWEILPEIKTAIKNIIDGGIEGYTEYKPGIWIGANAKISDSATLLGPAIIGCDTEIRSGAYIRENVIIGSGCVIGNSSELKNCILLDRVQVPHYNYVGDSVLGNGSHMGAGSICSNLKSDGKAVVIHADNDINTGLRKVGGFLGDNADIGCGAVINPGTVIGRNSTVYPLTSVRGVIPPDSIVKSTAETVKRKM